MIPSFFPRPVDGKEEPVSSNINSPSEELGSGSRGGGGGGGGVSLQQ